MNREKVYLCIDLKSFYASVECVLRNLNPLTTHLVVADESRTSKTICLAISPSLKEYGLPGRARLFEVQQKIKEINLKRKEKAPRHRFLYQSYDSQILKNKPDCELDYIIAPPQMAKYIEYSNKVYSIYLRFIAAEDIHVYSIDEVFMDISSYLKPYHKDAKKLATAIIKTIDKELKITATAGIGSNLYLAKVAMDIVAKHVKANQDGVRIAQLNEKSYRQLLWNHQPLTDFWRVGKGIQRRLEKLHLYTMGDIARCSLGKFEEYHNEDLLYQEFGINAQLLIDHAWGVEPCSILDIKKHQPKINSLSSGQVLACGYSFAKAKIVIKEMADALALSLVEKNMVTNQIQMVIGYDAENLKNPKIKNQYEDQLVLDYYNRETIKSAHGHVNLNSYTSSYKKMMNACEKLFTQIVDPSLFIRRLNISIPIYPEEIINQKQNDQQLSLFNHPQENQKQQEKQSEIKDKKVTQTILKIKQKYGKNAILKGMDLQEGATTKERNQQIGGHKA